MYIKENNNLDNMIYIRNFKKLIAGLYRIDNNYKEPDFLENKHILNIPFSVDIIIDILKTWSDRDREKIVKYYNDLIVEEQEIQNMIFTIDSGNNIKLSIPDNIKYKVVKKYNHLLIKEVRGGNIYFTYNKLKFGKLQSHDYICENCINKDEMERCVEDFIFDHDFYSRRVLQQMYNSEVVTSEFLQKMYIPKDVTSEVSQQIYTTCTYCESKYKNESISDGKHCIILQFPNGEYNRFLDDYENMFRFPESIIRVYFGYPSGYDGIYFIFVKTSKPPVKPLSKIFNKLDCGDCPNNYKEYNTVNETLKENNTTSFTDLE